MAPSKTSPPASLVRASSKMKQSTLGFTSAKRTNSLGSKNKRPITSSLRISKSADKDANSFVENRKERAPDADVYEVPSDHEPSSTVPSKTTRRSTGLKAESDLKVLQKDPTIFEPETLDIEDKAGRYTRCYNEVRKRMGKVDPSKPEPSPPLTT